MLITIKLRINGAAIVWTKHFSADHSRSKHVDVRYHRIIIRQLQEDGHVKVEKVDTWDNNADPPFTKAFLPQADFERHLGTLMSIVLATTCMTPTYAVWGRGRVRLYADSQVLAF